MKKKYILIFLTGLILISMVTNSCKKDTQLPIQSLFTTGAWQLSSIMVFHYLGSSQLTTDTLNTSCDTSQIFTFPTNTTCTYTNFHCVHQPTASGTWAITRDQLYLQVAISCKDTVPGDTAFKISHPFATAQIYNIGPYSMILKVGDIGSYYTATTKRTIYQYGFVHIKGTTTN